LKSRRARRDLSIQSQHSKQAAKTILMCGIIGALSFRDIVPVLVSGLKRLEYRGYDSCGVAVYAGGLTRARSTQRVSDLAVQVQSEGIAGKLAVAHTRWATHGAPAVHNAHPIFSHGKDDGVSEERKGTVALVHNGIIENHDALRVELKARGYRFVSETDSEVIAHLIDDYYAGDLVRAVQLAVARLHGAFAIAVFVRDESERLVVARNGSPLVIGVAAQETFIASDAIALAGCAPQIIYLDDGDVADVRSDGVEIWSSHASLNGTAWSLVQRPFHALTEHEKSVELGPYSHFMQKEIFEQPRALAETLEGVTGVDSQLFGDHAEAFLARTKRVLILACGTSYYAGLAAKYWLESLAKIPCDVEIASEYRYRESVAQEGTLVVAISQSGETADTLAAVKHAMARGLGDTLTICNVRSSSMVRLCKLAYVTRAGAEIGVASTKAFTTQLAALFLLTLALAKQRGQLSPQSEMEHLRALRHLPVALASVLALEPQIVAWAEKFARKENALFLGRGLHYPIALEGALKLKEISYIHAEAYPAGELKHGPLALVTAAMPVVTVAPNNALLEKLKSNLEEVRARGGELYVFADADTRIVSRDGMHVIVLPEDYGALSPILHVVPLQLLAYHTACVRGTDVDKPRNLAKSVTVE
jgi:glucosamine--fructose-6-phosphate aminotransferase (isomerizing)